MNGEKNKNNNYNHLYQKYVLHLPVVRWPNVVNIMKTINRMEKKNKKGNDSFLAYIITQYYRAYVIKRKKKKITHYLILFIRVGFFFFF